MFEGMNYVYEVYKEMSFSKAARNLYIAQPSLSAAVKKAEKQIGYPIFDRSTVPIQLTAAGEEYIRSIEIIMDVEKSFENYINDINELKSGTISVGGTNLFTSFILPPILSAYTGRYPLIKINLVESSSAILLEQLFSGKLDLIIDNHHIDHKIYGKSFFCEEHLLLTVPRKFSSNQAAAKYQLSAADIRAGKHLDEAVEPVDLKLFRDDPFLLLKSGNDTRSRANKVFQQQGFTPNVKLKLDQQITSYNLSSYGMGISFTGDILIKHIKPNPELVYYKLDERKAARDINFYYKENRYMSRAVTEFLKMAKTELLIN